MVATKSEIVNNETAKKGSQEKVVSQPDIILEMLPQDKMNVARLSQLIELNHSGIPGSKEAHRPISQKNLQSLLSAQEEKIPPIDIQAISKNGESYYVIVSGHHRFQRKICLGLYEFHMSKGTWPVDDNNEPLPLDVDVINEFLTVNENGKTYKRDLSQDERTFIDQVKINVRPLNANSFDEVIQHAFQANMSLGEQASGQVRSRYGVWLYQKAQREGRIKFTWRDAAAMCGVSHSSLIQFANAKKRLTEEQEQGLQLETTSAQKAADIEASDAKAVKAMAKALRDVYERIKDDSVSESALYLRSAFKDSDFEMLQAMATILEAVTRVETPSSERVNGHQE